MSLEPHQFKEMVENVRELEKAAGDGLKRVMDSEGPVLEIIKARREHAK